MEFFLFFPATEKLKKWPRNQRVQFKSTCIFKSVKRIRTHFKEKICSVLQLLTTAYVTQLPFTYALYYKILLTTAYVTHLLFLFKYIMWENLHLLKTFSVMYLQLKFCISNLYFLEDRDSGKGGSKKKGKGKRGGKQRDPPSNSTVPIYLQWNIGGLCWSQDPGIQFRYPTYVARIQLLVLSLTTSQSTHYWKLESGWEPGPARDSTRDSGYFKRHLNFCSQWQASCSTWNCWDV